MMVGNTNDYTTSQKEVSDPNMQYMVVGVFLIAEHQFVVSFVLARISDLQIAENISETIYRVSGSDTFLWGDVINVITFITN